MENFLFDLFLTLTFGQGARISAILTNNNFPPAILMMIVGDRRMAGWLDGRMAGWQEGLSNEQKSAKFFPTQRHLQDAS